MIHPLQNLYPQQSTIYGSLTVCRQMEHSVCSSLGMASTNWQEYPLLAIAIYVAVPSILSVLCDLAFHPLILSTLSISGTTQPFTVSASYVVYYHVSTYRDTMYDCATSYGLVTKLRQYAICNLYLYFFCTPYTRTLNYTTREGSSPGEEANAHAQYDHARRPLTGTVQARNYLILIC